MAFILHDPTTLAAIIAAVFLFGLSKGGLVGLSLFSLPILYQVMSPWAALGLVLPILISQDILTVYLYWRVWNLALVRMMVPAMVVGVGLGYLCARVISNRGLFLVLGLVSTVFALREIWLMRHKHRARKILPHQPWPAAIAGMMSGFCSMIANAGGPPYQIYAMPRGMEPRMLAGTTGLFFALMNWTKVPFFAALGVFSRENLVLAALMIPVSFLATYTGVWLVARIKKRPFYLGVYGLMVLVGLKLIYDGIFAT
ncbi:MAG: sulfite exporter TauE/SafE family protein [Candidatus Symbiobacter sp.]|nr:sulfite exporter TauE/SafE family protein [Candidatus Symbiobacter sp.]